MWYGLAVCTEQDRTENRLGFRDIWELSLNLQICPVVRLLTLRIDVPLACFFQNP
jgi:hypothetical protein